jgi:hypothetical protein
MCIIKDELDFKIFNFLNFFYMLIRFRRKLQGIMFPARTVFCFTIFCVPFRNKGSEER